MFTVYCEYSECIQIINRFNMYLVPFAWNCSIDRLLYVIVLNFQSISEYIYIYCHQLSILLLFVHPSNPEQLPEIGWRTNRRLQTVQFVVNPQHSFVLISFWRHLLIISRLFNTNCHLIQYHSKMYLLLIHCYGNVISIFISYISMILSSLWCVFSLTIYY